ncbi:hypothetical protein QTP88_028523 [Uroleucon formosanum]
MYNKATEVEVDHFILLSPPAAVLNASCGRRRVRGFFDGGYILLLYGLSILLLNNKKSLKMESTQCKNVVESYQESSLQCSINTVQEVPLKRKPKSKRLFPFYLNIEKFTNRLIGKLKMPLVKGRCTADRVLKWVLKYRKQNVLFYRNTFKHLKKIINKKINHSVVLPNDDKLDYPLLRFILGESRHSKYTELFYCNTILPFTNPISNEHWEKLSEFVETNNLPSDFICLYCIKIFRSNALPPSCILNNLYSPVTPQVLLCLNDFERILIQRTKTFQVVVKMSSVAGRKQPKNVMNQKVIGRAFHLPLPLVETLKKLPIPNQAIIEHELYILGNNILYKDIFIPHYNNFENDILTMKTEYLLSDLTTDEDEILNTTDNDNNINSLESIDSVDCKQSTKTKAIKKLSKLDDDSSRTAGLQKYLNVKLNSKIMLQRNIDVSNGLVNGAIGTVKNIINGIDGKPQQIQVIFNEKMHNLERVKGKFELFHGAFVFRKQFPITVVYGITIHKSQGMSLENCIVDVGNSIFSCGQTYVALSRVNSQKGLHLINFDPSNIKAQIAAIKEYNRLRAKCRPDLNKIPLKHNKNIHVKDIIWKEASNVQVHDIQTFQHQPISDLSIPGFSNLDAVSCYANASLQVIFNCTRILNILINSLEDTVLKKLAYSYTSQVCQLSAFSIRNQIGHPYFNIEQQDAAEFISALISLYEPLHNSLLHQLQTILKCSRCKKSRVHISNNYIIQLNVPNDTKTVTMHSMLNDMSKEVTIENITCGACNTTSNHT